MSVNDQQAFYQELSLLWKFRDVPFITKLYAYCDTSEAVMLLKYYPFGTLSSYVLGDGQAINVFPYSKVQVHVLLKILAQTLAYMHSQQIVHCDLKP
jgi:serine/threonine protein kinase